MIVKISFTPSGPTHFAREVMLVSDYLAARRFAAWSSLAVSELQLLAATPLWLYHRAASLPSWIEFNCLRSAMVGKAARLAICWHDAACRLVIPLRQVALAQLYKYHRQASLKAALLPVSPDTGEVHHHKHTSDGKSLIHPRLKR